MNGTQVLSMAEILLKMLKSGLNPSVEYRGRKIKQVDSSRFVVMDEDGHDHESMEAAIQCIDRCDTLRSK